jgi:hypothetical protein
VAYCPAALEVLRDVGMTLHFDQLMIIGLCMLPGGIIIGILLMCLLGALGWEIGSFAGLIPGVIIFVAGIAVFLVGLGQELH